MNDFGGRLSVAMGLCGFGTAGAISIYVGALITTALYRGVLAGLFFMLLGRLFAIILDEAKFKKPEMPPEVKAMPEPNKTET